MKTLPQSWAFEERMGYKWADPEKNNGIALRVQKIADSYYKAEIMILDEAKEKRSWSCGLWCNSATEDKAIEAVEQYAVSCGMCELL